MKHLRYNFDEILDFKGSNSTKHGHFTDEVIRLWVSDMDFASPPAIFEAMKKRLDHHTFAYEMDLPGLRTTLCERMAVLYDWEVRPEEIVFVPGVIPGMNTALRMDAQPNGRFLLPMPAYPPMQNATGGVGQQPNKVALRRRDDGPDIRYEIDFDALEAAIDANTNSLILCNPQNPTGRVFTRAELTRLAEICERHDLLIISDEIHSDLVYSGHEHIPIATLAPEISQRTVTLMAPSKTFVLPSLRASFAIIQNPVLRARYEQAHHSAVGEVSTISLVAMKAAYEHGQDWLEQVLVYLEANRDYCADFIRRELSGVRVVIPEGTYLMWLETGDLARPELKVNPEDGLNPHLNQKQLDWITATLDPFFMKYARVALNKGATFGVEGNSFVRFNFASPRSVLKTALDRMKEAINGNSAWAQA